MRYRLACGTPPSAHPNPVVPAMQVTETTKTHSCQPRCPPGVIARYNNTLTPHHTNKAHIWKRSTAGSSTPSTRVNVSKNVVPKPIRINVMANASSASVFTRLSIAKRCCKTLPQRQCSQQTHQHTKAGSNRRKCSFREYLPCTQQVIQRPTHQLQREQHNIPTD
jgi:hypothetical protein